MALKDVVYIDVLARPINTSFGLPKVAKNENKKIKKIKKKQLLKRWNGWIDFVHMVEGDAIGLRASPAASFSHLGCSNQSSLITDRIFKW